MNTRTLTLVLAGLAMVNPLATDTYLPSFPSVAQHFGASELMMQQTLSLYLACAAVMTLFHGTLSDALGRRPVVLGSLVVFCLGSLGATLATSFSALLACRALQGLSAGAGMVVGQAIVRDRFQGAEVQRMTSHIMMVFGLAPAVAPVIGGYLDSHLGWRASFGFLTLFAVLLFGLCLRWLPESLPRAQRHPLHLRHILRNYAAALGHRRFLLGVLAIGSAFIGLGLYISSAAHFVIEVLHLPSTAFAWLFLPMISGMVLGSAIGSRLVHRLAPTTTIRAGLALMATAAALNLGYNALFAAAVPWAVLPVFVYAFGTSLVMPAMALITQGLLPTMRGLAASLQNFVMMLVFSLLAGFVAPLLFDSGFKLALGMCAGVALSASFWAFSLRAARRHAPG